ncbi:MAG: hypothetical protein KC457_25390 [Myxococcales bacterium]|nr:hypothetical protein [Myxococcales bacterium]
MEIPAKLFGALTSEHTLREGLFTCRLDKLGLLCLAHVCGNEGALVRHLLVPTTEEIVDELEQGALSLREALTRTAASFWIVDAEPESGKVGAVHSLGREELPEACLPAPGLMLRDDLEPLLVVRLDSPDLAPGAAPRDAIIHAFQNVPAALKRLIDHVLDRDARKRVPEEWLRALYRMPVQQVSFTDFEVVYRRPADTPAKNSEAGRALAKVGALLEKALAVAAGAKVNLADEDNEAVLDAAHRLSPPGRSSVVGVSFGGAMLPRKAQQHQLTQQSRKLVARQRAKRRATQYDFFFELAGRVGEVDFDALTFELRDVEEVGCLTIRFELEAQSSIVDAGNEATLVRVVGTRDADGNYTLLALFPAQQDGAVDKAS